MTIIERVKGIKVPLPLILVLLLQVFKGAIWILIIPPWQIPDEQVHFAYVQYLGEENRLPVVLKDNNGLSKELVQYMDALGAPKISFHQEVKENYDTTDLQKLRYSVPEKSCRTSSGSTMASGYPPAYYSLGALVYKLFYNHSIVIRFYAIRFLALIISLVAVFFSYLIGRKIVPETPTFAIALSVMTSMQPMFSMTSAGISNDILQDSLSIVIMFWLFNVITDLDKLSPRNIILGGILLGIGLLTKANMVYITFAVIATLFLVLVLRKKNFRVLTKTLFLILIPIFVLYIGWAVFSWSHYHSLLGMMPFQPISNYNGTLTEYLKLNFGGQKGLARIIRLWIINFWGCFGWLDTLFPQRFYRFLLMFTVIGLVGVILGLFKVKKHQEKSKLTMIIINVIFYFGNIAFLYAVEFVYFREFHNTMLQGRYLLTALVPFNILLLFGYRSFFPKKFSGVVDHLFIVGALALNLASVVLLLHRYYGIV